MEKHGRTFAGGMERGVVWSMGGGKGEEGGRLGCGNGREEGEDVFCVRSSMDTGMRMYLIMIMC